MRMFAYSQHRELDGRGPLLFALSGGLCNWPSSLLLAERTCQSCRHGKPSENGGCSTSAAALFDSSASGPRSVRPSQLWQSKSKLVDIGIGSLYSGN